VWGNNVKGNTIVWGNNVKGNTIVWGNNVWEHHRLGQ
jgi:hypothetical protein